VVCGNLGIFQFGYRMAFIWILRLVYLVRKADMISGIVSVRDPKFISSYVKSLCLGK